MAIEIGIVGMINTDKVIFEDRVREELGDLVGLENNMKESGLITPLAVKDNKDGTYKLLAGGRRFTILKENNVQQIPVRIYEEDLSILEMKIIEKSENFYRKDLEYFEMDALTAEIHSMKQQLCGVKAPGPGQDGWGMRDTADMVGAKSPATVVESVKRAEAREAFPELFENCKSANDASKMIKKMDEALIKQTIADKLDMQNTKGTLHQLSKCFIVKDFLEGVKEIPDGIMHLVEIDPPYAINLAAKKKKEGESQYMLSDYNEIDSEDYINFMYNTFKECYRVMTDHSWLICWFAPEPYFCSIYELLIKAGFGTTRMCGIWTKSSPAQNMHPMTRLSNSYEMFFYAWKGQPVLNKAGRNNEFNFSPIPSNQKVHPTERPIELTDELYRTFAFPGSRILIPFLGSGNGIISAHHLGMSPTGFELSKSCKDSFLVKVHGMK
jgi:DNA modification methylase